jgi:Tfp pilus assembly protein PilF
MGIARGHLAAGRYVEAMTWIDKTIAARPGMLTAVRIKVVLSELLGHHEEARRWLAQLRRGAPDMTIESFTAYAARNYTVRLRALFVDVLRRVGLPES